MSATRPKMHARDSSGKQVSLLNDEPSQSRTPPFLGSNYTAYDSSSMIRSSSGTSDSSSPSTPDLLRSDSYDSQITNDPASPLTPNYLFEVGRQTSFTSAVPYKEPAIRYEEIPPRFQIPVAPIRPPYADSRTPSYMDAPLYDEDSHMSGFNSEKGGKRYPCRFRDTQNCEKTFTTSGHASRHSKIHTAEKAVHCTYPGCQKKFTRADNMKQHLETHYKERSRLSGGAQKSSSSSKTLTMPAGVKKSRNSRPSTPKIRPELLPVDPALYAQGSVPQVETDSPVSHGSLDMSDFQRALVSRPRAARTPSDGFDALYMAAAYRSQN